MSVTQHSEAIGVGEAAQRLGMSESTVWRMIRRGTLASVRQHGRRLIPAEAIDTQLGDRQRARLSPFDKNHPMFRLIGAGRGGGNAPGARDKHAILDR